jgi:hypothetical protein
LGLEAPQNLSLQAKSKAESEAVAVAVAKTKAKAKAQTSEDSLVQPAESEQDTLLPLLASEAPEPVGNLLGVYAQAPLTTTSDSDDDPAGLITDPNVTSSQVTGSAALAPVLIAPGLGLFGASAALVSWDSRDSNSQTAPPSDTTPPIFISKASVSENTPNTTVVHTVSASDNRGVAKAHRC